MLRVIGLVAFILGASWSNLAAQANSRPLRIAFLDFGKSATGRLVADQLAHSLMAENQTNPEFHIIDRDQVRAAALGAGYQGSLNMTLEEARDLASAIGCDFFFTGEAQTMRRSPETPAYFESYAAVYLVSGRTGKLALWERRSAQRATSEEADSALRAELKGKDVIHRYQQVIRRAQKDESAERASAVQTAPPVIEIMSEDDGVNKDVRAPRPFRRLKPPYPETAARAEVEAIVDVVADIDARGEVGRVEVARWAGYGLDQSVIDTVRQLHFFPAMREGVAIPMRVLLRYNFRKPPVQNREPAQNRLQQQTRSQKPFRYCERSGAIVLLFRPIARRA